MAGEYEELIEQLKEEGLEEWAEKFEPFARDSMRKRIGSTAQLEKEKAALEAEIKTLRDAPVRREALAKVGVDLNSLRPAEREAIESAQAEKYDEDWAKSIVEKYELPVGEAQPAADGEKPNAAAFGQPTGPTGNGGSTGVNSRSTLTPEEVAKWPFDKWVRFEDYCAKEGLDAAERLLQGEKVSGITFS